MPDALNSDLLSADYPPSDEYSQLYQARIPLDDAADAFNVRDASGRIPIVVIPKRLSRIQNELVAAAVITLLAAIVLQVITSNPARILKLRGKGALAAGADADIVLLDASTLEIDGVIAKGRWLMRARVPLFRGTFE